MNPLRDIELFQPISLSELEEKSSMLKREDSKYILTHELSSSTVGKLRDAFDILSINGRRAFEYENVYFDDENVCFEQHQQGKRHRFKARTRRYLNSEHAYFEVKFNGKAGQTDKLRIPCTPQEHGSFPPHFREFLAQKYQEHYRKEFPYTLLPSVTTAYTRMTLVAKVGGERMTIDFNVTFGVDGKKLPTSSPFAIVETKSRNGNGIADKILRSENIRAVTTSCSKFCLAKSLGGTVKSYNAFRPIVHKYLLPATARV